MEWLFWVILGAGALSIAVYLVVAFLQFSRRWNVKAYSGVLVRYGGTAVPTNDVERLLRIGCMVARTTVADFYPRQPELADFRVEVVREWEVRTPTVPGGKLPDGTKVSASIRTERMYPFSRLHYVAVVTEERAAELIAHEVARHILAKRLHGTMDAGHEIQALDDLEVEMERRIIRALSL